MGTRPRNAPLLGVQRNVASVMVLACAVSIGACRSSSSSSNGPRNAAPAVVTTAPPPPSRGSTSSTATSVPAAVKASSGCGKASVSPGVSDETVMSAGAERTFRLTVPAGYDGKTPFPVVLGLHSLTASHLRAFHEVGFDDRGARDEFIAVAPSGRLHDGEPFWFAAPTRDNYDVAFIADLLDRIEGDLCVDRARVYATGFSNGAQMASVLACRLPHRIAAVAPVAGVEFSDACDEGPVAVVAFHGTDDSLVEYDGDGFTATRIAAAYYWNGDVPDGLPEHRGVDAAMEAWAQHNACDPEPVEEQVARNVRRRTWQHCRARTVLYVIEGGGHGLPEAAPDGSGVDASKLIFEFFLG